MLALVNAGFIWYQINNTSDSSLVLRAILTLVVTFFLSTGITLFAESWKRSAFTKWSGIIPLIYGISFFFSINTLDVQNGIFDEPFIYFILHLVGFVALIFFAPYYPQGTRTKTESREYTNYFTHVSWAMLMATIVGGSLVALGSIALGTVGALFDVHTPISDWHLYENWFILALAIIAPLYGLISLPKKEEVKTNVYETNKFFAFIIKFIALPFIVIYFCILYAYSIKVLSNISEWPKWEISWLVIGFSTFGYLCYIFSKPYEWDNTIVRLFRKYFPFAVIPQLPMLGYAIMLRINQYDLTVNRYFVVIFGIWLTIISIYFVVSKLKSLTIIPASLTALAVLISLGPWSVYQLPLTRQYNRLVVNLEKAEILQNWVITPARDDINSDVQNNIYSWIEYVCQYDECNKIKQLFPEIVAEAEKKDEIEWNENKNEKWWNVNNEKSYPGINTWIIVDTVTRAINIEREYPQENRNNKYIILSTKDDYLYSSGLDVSGFDTLYSLNQHDFKEWTSLDKNYASINTESEELVIHNWDTVVRFSLKEINAELLKKYTKNSQNVIPSDLIKEFTQNSQTVKLILSNYSLKNPNYNSEDNTKDYDMISGFVLIKK